MSPKSLPKTLKDWETASTIPVSSMTMMTIIRIATGIKMIVIENPFWGIRAICKQLNSKKYGAIRIGWLRMHSILRSLNLETREKRYRFYRSR